MAGPEQTLNLGGQGSLQRLFSKLWGFYSSQKGEEDSGHLVNSPPLLTCEGPSPCLSAYQGVYLLVSQQDPKILSISSILRNQSASIFRLKSHLFFFFFLLFF